MTAQDMSQAPQQSGATRPAMAQTVSALPGIFSGLSALNYARAAPSNHDPRPLTGAEQMLFVPLACAHPKKNDQTAHRGSPETHPPEYDCRTLFAYPDPDRLRSRGRNGVHVTFTAISYGGFTKAGEDEAYVSYESDVEPHITLFGGGILFHRIGAAWHIITWIPAEQRDKCVALPDAAPEEMLCRQSDGHAETSSDAIFTTLTARYPEQIDRGHQIYTAERKTTYNLSRNVTAIRDNRFQQCSDISSDSHHDDFTDDSCVHDTQHTGLLIEIKTLRRSSHPGAFAEAQISYATPNDLEKACKTTCYLDAPENEGKIYFSLTGKIINVTMPENLDLQSAPRPNLRPSIKKR